MNTFISLHGLKPRFNLLLFFFVLTQVSRVFIALVRNFVNIAKHFNRFCCPFLFIKLFHFPIVEAYFRLFFHIERELNAKGQI
jgi:hypothetical protein